MQQPDPRLEEIKILEKADAIKTTKSYAGLGRFTFDKDAVQFRQSIGPKVFFLLFACIVLTPAFFKIAKIFIKAPTGPQIAGVVFATLLGLLLLVVGIHRFSAEKSVRIRVDTSGITLDGELYSWNDIYETAILTRYRSAYLTIVLKEKASYRLYSLSNFRAFDVSFPVSVSKYIEHFKQSFSNASS